MGFIMGKVLDEKTYDPLVAAHVILSSTKDSLKYYTTTSQTGRFTLKDIRYGNYRLEVSHIGYHNNQQALALAEPKIELRTITLTPQAIQLSSVEVEGVQPIATQVGDTLQYQADAFKTKPDATAQDLVEKLPGVIVQDGEVQAQGEKVEKVLVDNKPFFGDDPNTALRNLPAEIIDKIQIFDQQSEQSQISGFDDGNTVKTMNIMTRPGMKNGRFGKLVAGIGLAGKYQLAGNLNIFNGDRRISILAQTNNVNIQNFAIDDIMGVAGSEGRRRGGGRMSGGGPGSFDGRGSGGGPGNFLVPQQGGLTTTHAAGVNYQDSWSDKLEVSGSYFFNYSDNDNEWISNQYHFTDTDEDALTYREHEITDSRNINHRLNLHIDYDLGENDFLRIIPRLSIQQNEGSSILNAGMALGGVTTDTLDNFYNSDLESAQLSNMIFYRHEFGKRGRNLMLGFSTDYNYNNGESYQDDNSISFDEGSTICSLERQTTAVDGDGRTLGANISYSEPIGSFGGLIISCDLQQDYSSADQRTYLFSDLTGSYSVFDTSLSNTFDSHYLTHSTGIGYRYNKRKFMFVLRGNYEYGDLVNKQVFPYEIKTHNIFTSFQPTAVLRYRLDSTSRIHLVYRTSTHNPSLSQLQNVLDNSNPLQLEIGNPALKQQYGQSVFLRYSSTNMNRGSVFFSLFSLNMYDNYIGERTITSIADSTFYQGIQLDQGTQLTIPENIDGYYSLRSFFTYGIPVAILQSNLNFNLSADVTQTPGYIGDELNYANSRKYGLNMVVSSNVSEDLDFTLSLRADINDISNSLNSTQNNKYNTQSASFKLDWATVKNFTLSSNISYSAYNGYSIDNDSNILWNLGIGKKLFKNDLGQIQLSVYDLLNQNKRISESVTSTYLEETESLVLTRYVMLSLSYNLRDFRGSKS